VLFFAAASLIRGSHRPVFDSRAGCCPAAGRVCGGGGGGERATGGDGLLVHPTAADSREMISNVIIHRSSSCWSPRRQVANFYLSLSPSPPPPPLSFSQSRANLALSGIRIIHQIRAFAGDKPGRTRLGSFRGSGAHPL